MKFILLLLLPFQLLAQDLTGVWKGTLQTKDDSVMYELVISGSDQKLSGYALTQFISDGVEKVGVKKIVIKYKNGKTSIEDGDLIYNNYSSPNKIKMFADLTLQVEDTLMFLTGSFITRSLQSAPNVGTIYLKKQNRIDDSKLLALLDKSNLINTLSFIPPKRNDDVAVIPAVITVINKKVEAQGKTSTEPTAKDVVVAVQAPVNDESIIANSSLEKKIEVIIEKEKKQEKTSATTTVKKSTPSIPVSDIANNTSTSQKKKTESSSVVKNTQSGNSKTPTVKDDDINSTASQKQKTQLAVEQKQESKKTSEPAKVKDELVVAIQKREPANSIQKTDVKTSETTDKQANRKTEQTADLPTGKKVESVISSDKNTTKPLPAIVTNTVAELSKRRTEVIESVSFKSDSLVLTLYDNGVVDGDTVSVVLNGNVLMARQGLTASAISTTVYVTQEMGDSLQLVMFAENLGSIPPNTGLLVIQDGNDRYNIRFSGDYQKSSAIILRRKR